MMMAGQSGGLAARAATLALLANGCGLLGGKEAPQPQVTPASDTAGNAAASGFGSGGAAVLGGAANAGGANAGGANAGGANAGGANAGGANAGGANAGGAAGSAGQAWVSPVAADVSQHWTWHECGRIAPDRTDELRHDGSTEIMSLAISTDGSLLVSDADRVIGWRVAEAFGDSQPLWRTGGEGGINVALSPDGRLGSISGDVRLIFDTTTGKTLFFEGTSALPTLPEYPCIGSELNFSPDSRLVAGKHYLTTVDVLDTQTFQPVGHFASTGCAQGVAFSADGLEITAPDGESKLDELLPMRPANAPLTEQTRRWSSVTRAPNGSLRWVVCTSFTDCRSDDGLTMPEHGGRRLSVSTEGHWSALGGKLRHAPSGEVRVFDEQATEAVFAPNGDIIAGEIDASLVRFCRED